MTFAKSATFQRHHEIKTRKSSSVFHDRYRNICTLGKGNFGKVFLAEDLTTGDQVAIKVVDKRLFKNNDQKQHAQREQSICEEFATDLKHKNIVQIYDVVSDEECIYVVMEYVQGGELFDRIKQDQKLTEPLARRWFREIVEAVYYIHENGIVHRDLKPENVLIDRKQRVRVCDFGFGKRIRERQEVLSTYCGSPFYAAPEMVTATPYKGPPVDMWSCGVILYAMLTGTLPFQGDDMPQLFRKISHGLYNTPRFISSDAANLINRLLCKNAKERITAAACLNHPWLQASSYSATSSIRASLVFHATATPVAAYHSSSSPSSPSSSTMTTTATTTTTRRPPSQHHLHDQHRKGAFLASTPPSSVKKQKYHTHEKLATSTPHCPASLSISTESKHPPSSSIPPTIYSKRVKGSSPFRFVYPKKPTQVVPSTSDKPDPSTTTSPKKKVKSVEIKIIHRFKGFFKAAFQKRIT